MADEMGTKIKQRIRRALLLPLLLLVAIPFSLLNTDFAQAATPVSVSSSTDRQALSYWYYSAIAECFSRSSKSGGDMGVDNNGSNVTSGSLFFLRLLGYDKTVYGQYPKATITSADDGIIGCTENSNQLTKKALTFWGITGTDLLCGMGYVRQSGQTCSGGDNNFVDGSQSLPSDPTGAFKTYIKSKIYGGKDPGVLSAAAKYSYYSGTLINACTTGSASKTKPKDAAANAIYELKTSVDDKGVYQTSYYNATGDHIQTWNGVYTTPSSDTKSTCKAVMDLANNSFPAFAAAASCSTNTLISANDTYLSACVSGASNKTDIGYCAKNYPNGFSGTADNGSVVDNTKVREACYAGQGNGAAESCIKYGYTSSDLTACINGSKHPTDTNYCNATYPAPDTLSGAGIKQDSNKTEREACLRGQNYGGIVLSTAVSPQSDCNTNPNATGCTPDDGVGSSCVIEGIGWMICPVFNFLAGVADSTYGVIQSLLVTDVKVVSTDSGTYRAWSVMRTFANIGFVIVFLIIIFSQLTGVAVSNYGVKKLLPRIIIAAILVNLSFFVTQIAVDISNILGGSLKTLLEGISVSDPSQVNSVAATGNTFTDIAAGIFGGQLALVGVAGAGAAVYFGGAGLIIPIILAAVLAILITLFILIARQALIILLVVLAPLAFLAMLLPNTETYFKQWRKAFVALLLVYPMIALVFGASHLASAILLDSFSGSDNTLGKIVALAVMVLPLFVVPSLLKGSLNAIPAIGGMASKLAGRANGLIGKQAKQGYAKSTFGRSASIRRQAKENYRAGKFAESVSKGGVASFLAKEPGILPSQRAANKAVDRTAIQTAEKADAEDVKAATMLMKSRITEQGAGGQAHAEAELASALKSGDSVKARAAYSGLTSMGAGGVEAARKVMTSTTGADGKRVIDSNAGMSNALKQHIINNHPDMKTTDNRQMGWATNDPSVSIDGKAHLAGLTDTQIASQTPDSIASGDLSPEKAKRILDNIAISPNIKDSQRAALQAKAGGSSGSTSGLVLPGDSNFNVPRS